MNNNQGYTEQWFQTIRPNTNISVNYSAEYEYEQLNDTNHSDIININYIMDSISAK